MTFREKLADWISGGALTRVMMERHEYYKVALVNACHIVRIHNATKNVKNGTGVKVARMTKEVLTEPK